ncbi:hypothetical protein G5714_024657 [Onychostoma macrolepis]|uniref:Uncharacterized protein n=1 Tax=Onychostoma macrolepis TaxID=369639 RepID=A0A7J6BH74_9TELE|nr:hypothetical protein G5714_024657 [Onychostoma macrolepis]
MPYFPSRAGRVLPSPAFQVSVTDAAWMGVAVSGFLPLRLRGGEVLPSPAFQVSVTDAAWMGVAVSGFLPLRLRVIASRPFG